MTILQEIFHPAIDPTKLQGSGFDTLNYINTIKFNIIMQVILIVVPFLLWLFFGFGTGGTRKMRLARPNYYFFLVLIFIQIIIIVLYDFPIFLALFE